MVQFVNSKMTLYPEKLAAKRECADYFHEEHDHLDKRLKPDFHKVFFLNLFRFYLVSMNGADLKRNGKFSWPFVSKLVRYFGETTFHLNICSL